MTEVKHNSVAIIERGEISPSVHPMVLVQQAVEKGLDPETIRKLMDLADRHAATEARKAFTVAMVSLKADLPTVIKRDMIVAFQGSKGKVSYTHTSLAAVMDAVTDHLTRHGFSISWNPRTDSGTVHVECTLVHSAGHSESTTISAPVDKSGSKSDAQGVASTITLLSRYTALALLGIATRDHIEPESETPPDLVDTAKNMKAVKFLVDNGYTKKQAEELVGKPVRVWTAADLAKLKEWLKEIDATKREKTETKRSAADKQAKKEEPPPPVKKPSHDSETSETEETPSPCAQPRCDAPATHGVYCGGHLPASKQQGEFSGVGPPPMTDEEAAAAMGGRTPGSGG